MVGSNASILILNTHDLIFLQLFLQIETALFSLLIFNSLTNDIASQTSLILTICFVGGLLASLVL